MTTAVGGAATLSRVLVPPVGGSSKYDCSVPMTVEPFVGIGALERHARDVDGLGLDVEIDDEIFGGHAGRRDGIVRAGCRRRR